MQKILPLLSTIIIMGCSAPEGSQRERFVPARPVTSIVSDTVTGTARGAWAATQIPFEDLNIKRQEIPEKLQEIMDNPYEFSPEMSCEDIQNEIGELDGLLGIDTFIPKDTDGMEASRRGEYVEQGANIARDRAVGIISNRANIIPFRGVVRKITGAEKHARKVEQAYQAGKLRRAFLRGIAISMGTECMDGTNLTPAPE